MASRYLSRQVLGSLSHLPTWFFIIGYPCFWMELYVLKAPQGVTSPVAWVLFILVAVGVIAAWFKESGKESLLLHFWSSIQLNEKFLWLLAFLLAGIILFIVVLAGLQPIHLMQESDCMQYHYTLPRQHLILGSFTHIPWAADDLFLLPIDFALSPFWFFTILPNKLPQLIILFGLLGVLTRLVLALSGPNRSWTGIVVVLAFLGSHGLGIQMGTGMLDLTVVYLFFASLDSFRKGMWWMGSIEFSFFLWSKPLMPLQVLFVTLLLMILWKMARRFKWDIVNEFSFSLNRRVVFLLIILSVFIAGPFIAKSIHYAATPFFPWALGMMGDGASIKANPQAWDSLNRASSMWMDNVKDAYGHGRNLIAFIKHGWLLAVPEKGVNNAFDYPLGLGYLLFLGPFLFFFMKDLLQRRSHVSSFLVIVLWGLWWFSSQQARFLYIPLVLIFIFTTVRFVRVSKIFISCLIVALALELVSMWGAHKRDFLQPSYEVLRKEDKRLLEINRIYIQYCKKGYVYWPKHDVAYAQFPVKVIKENLPHTITF